MRRARVMPTLVAAVALIGTAGATCADVVTRRGAETPLEGRITSMDDAGVHVRTATGAEHFVPWDRVRAVDPDTDSALERRLETALELWRARTRVERV